MIGGQPSVLWTGTPSQRSPTQPPAKEQEQPPFKRYQATTQARGLEHRAHKERLSCSILEQKQELQRTQQTRGPQHKLQQGKSQQVIKITISASLLYFLEEQPNLNRLFQISKHSPSQEEATELCSQLPCSRELEAIGRGVGHLHPLMPSQGHRCFVFQLMHPAEEKLQCMQVKAMGG